MQEPSEKENQVKTEQDSYEYVREKIKERPVNRKKLLRRTLTTVAMAILFGFVACLAFFFLEPILSNWLYPEEEKAHTVVSLPEDAEETLPEDMLQTEADVYQELALLQQNSSDVPTPIVPADTSDTDVSEDGAHPEATITIAETVSGETSGDANETSPASSSESTDSSTQAAEGGAAGNEAQASDASSDTSTSGSTANETSEATGASQEPIEDSAITQAPLSLSVTDYERLYEDLSYIAGDAMRSVVQITSVTSDLDLFRESFDRASSVSGVIVTSSEDAIFILSKALPFAPDSAPYITFCDGSVAPATLRGSDQATGTCILSVALSELSEETQDAYAIASLGSSATGVPIGRPVIAIGSPTGNSNSISYGVITSASELLRRVDANYKQITTDIYGSKNASGVLINYNGKVIGLIDNSGNPSDMQNQISAIGITELKRIIEVMSNEQTRARLGIYGTDITYALSQSLEMPRGVYVNRFEMNSPAMNSGVQSSDIITGIGDTTIRTMAELTAALNSLAPGDTVTIRLQRMVQLRFRELEITVTLDENK